jgi:hypothetical protein
MVNSRYLKKRPSIIRRSEHEKMWKTFSICGLPVLWVLFYQLFEYVLRLVRCSEWLHRYFDIGSNDILDFPNNPEEKKKKSSMNDDWEYFEFTLNRRIFSRIRLAWSTSVFSITYARSSVSRIIFSISSYSGRSRSVRS